MTPRRRRMAGRIIRLAAIVLAVALTGAGLRAYLSWRAQQEASDTQAAFWSLRSSALNQKLAGIPSLQALVHATETRAFKMQEYDMAQLKAHKGSPGYWVYQASFVTALQPGSPQVRVLAAMVESETTDSRWTGNDYQEDPDFRSAVSTYACEGLEGDDRNPVIFAVSHTWPAGDYSGTGDGPPAIPVARPAYYSPADTSLFCEVIADGSVGKAGASAWAPVPLQTGHQYIDMSRLRYVRPSPVSKAEISSAESRSSELAGQLGIAGLYSTANPDPSAELQSSLTGGSGILLLGLAVGIRRYRRFPGRAGVGWEMWLAKGRAVTGTSGQDWAQAATSALVASAVAALDHPDDRERYNEEWGSDMAMITGRWSRLWWAAGVRLASVHALRAARRTPSKQTF